MVSQTFYTPTWKRIRTITAYESHQYWLMYTHHQLISCNNSSENNSWINCPRWLNHYHHVTKFLTSMVCALCEQTYQKSLHETVLSKPACINYTVFCYKTKPQLHFQISQTIFAWCQLFLVHGLSFSLYSLNLVLCKITQKTRWALKHGNQKRGKSLTGSLSQYV